MCLLGGEGVVKQFGGLTAVDNATFEVKEDEIVGLIGPNGAGKTTLFNCIIGNFNPDYGTIEFNGKEITDLKAHKVNRLGISRTFQVTRPYGNMTVMENVVTTAFHGRKATSSKKLCEEKAEKAIQFVGLSDDINTICTELSVPKLKSLELARAVAQDPLLILLDEILAGLTPKEKEEVLAKVRELNDQGIAVMIVEHDMDPIMNLSEEIVVMESGEIIAMDTPAKVSKDEKVIKAYLGEEYARIE